MLDTVVSNSPCGERKFTFGAQNENELVFVRGKNGKIDFLLLNSTVPSESTHDKSVYERGEDVMRLVLESRDHLYYLAPS